ncbi:uncharacterized protein I303_104122 [Kwoniella dejecticola CBS 10117]|uniref:Peptidase A1 domain-containing protein n=1 Tax=Kwoniella dejecticola CBS 10117 TaxID=1296121 RepID=A0A1A6A674_9TREE|nr:uncharacterized protein I303_04899 [Kwoniella dejecticola CBS 10117]OBR85563.1 hypothetical protein I303_04899 [Kwoniella dejecticola CBS 10117]
MFSGLFIVCLLPTFISALPTHSKIPVSRNALPITRQVARPKSMVKRWSGGEIGGLNVSMDGAPLLTAYTVPVDINGQIFELILDTGSADLWVPTTNFTCYNASEAIVPLSQCAFGGSYLNTSSLLPLSDDIGPHHFNQTYGSGDTIYGDAGLANVTIGGITVENQEIVAGAGGYWAHADGYNDGIIGFAGPLTEGMFAGSIGEASQDSAGRRVFYENWIMRAVREKAFEPYFSLTLNRPTQQQEMSTNATKDLGQLTLGGLPDIPLTNTTVTVPNLNTPLPKKIAPASSEGNTTTTSDAINATVITNVSECYIPQNCTVGQPQGAATWWAVPVTSWNFPGSEKLNSSAISDAVTILDSGTGLMTLSNDVAAGFAAAFEPPAVFNSTYSFYEVECNATIPDFSVTIANVTFTVDKKDLIFAGFSEFLEPGKCASSIVGSAAIDDLQLNLLGDRFLANVVATHNLETQEITITQRQSY